MAEYDGKTQYTKAAVKRLRDAEELLEHPSLAPRASGAERRHLRGSIYLAGYAIECVLKAYLITMDRRANTLTDVVNNRRRAGKKVKNILGSEGHNLISLLEMTNLDTQFSTNEDLIEAWGICVKWKSTWRYDFTDPSQEYAKEFIRATRRVHDWVKAQI